MSVITGKKSYTLADDKRFSMCKDYEEILNIIYYVGDRLISVPVLFDFYTLSSGCSKSKFERILRELVDKKIITQEYINLSYNPSRTRVIYMSKYAIAFVLGLKNTTGANNINKTRLSAEVVEKRILRSRLIFDRTKHLERSTVLEILDKLQSSGSTYCFRQNQYYDYFLYLEMQFGKIEFYNKTTVDIYKKDLEAMEKRKMVALRKGQNSKRNKNGDKNAVTNDKNKQQKYEYELIMDYTLPQVMSNVDISFILIKNGQFRVNIDYLITEDKAQYQKIIKNIAGIYHFFSSFLLAHMLVINIRMYFTNMYQKNNFEKEANKRHNDDYALYKTLQKHNVLYLDAINLKTIYLK